MANKFVTELKWRKIINNITNDDKLNYVFENHKGAYIGFDPSASSLHLGNYAAIMLLRRFKQFGLKTYAVIGGATGMIGDPSGKLSERILLNMDVIENNKNEIKKQLVKYAKVDGIIDNYDYYKNMNFLHFLRDVGKYININYLLEKDIIKSRLETGISFTEFSYGLIQGYDFVQLYKQHEIFLQAGGSDQWGNITTGCEMIRKMIGENNYGCGITINLLLNSNGQKFGKSEKGAIFLNEDFTSPYEMYQFLINQTDADVINLLKFLTMLDEPTIKHLEEQIIKEPQLKNAQKVLAQTILEDIHGKEKYAQAVKISQALFNDKISTLSLDELMQTFNTIPNVELPNQELTLCEILIKANVADSNRQARELIANNSITINGIRNNDPVSLISNSHSLYNKYTLIKKGKRHYYIVRWV